MRSFQESAQVDRCSSCVLIGHNRETGFVKTTDSIPQVTDVCVWFAWDQIQFWWMICRLGTWCVCEGIRSGADYQCRVTFRSADPVFYLTFSRPYCLQFWAEATAKEGLKGIFWWCHFSKLCSSNLQLCNSDYQIISNEFTQYFTYYPLHLSFILQLTPSLLPLLPVLVKNGSMYRVKRTLSTLVKVISFW